MTSGIYKIINICDNKYYLGSSQNIEKRWETHISMLNNNTHHNIYLQRAWNKYGEHNFNFEIMLCCDGYLREEIFDIEQIYLNELNNLSYNLSKNAKGGDNISCHPNRDEIVKKISRAVHDRYFNMTKEERKILSQKYSGENNPMFGKTHSKEIRKIISEAVINYFNNNEHYLKNKTFEEYWGEEKGNLRKNNLSIHASQRTGDKNGFFGKQHSKESKNLISEKRRNKYYGTQNIPILINNNIYSSLGEASKKLNIPMTTIRWRVLSKNKKFINYKYFK